MVSDLLSVKVDVEDFDVDRDSDKMTNYEAFYDIEQRILNGDFSVDVFILAQRILEAVERVNPRWKYDESFVKCVVMFKHHAFYFSCVDSLTDFIEMNSL